MDIAQPRVRDPERTWPITAPAARLSVAAIAFIATLVIVATYEHAPLDVQPGIAARLVAALAPLVAAFVAALAVWRPWRGLVAIVLSTPLVNVAQVSWMVGDLQVISQTVFVAALAAGIGFEAVAVGIGSPVRSIRATLRTPAAIPLLTVPGLAVVAVLSTLRSPDVPGSFGVLLHGILEPMAMGVAVVLLRPGRRRLATLAVALGVSVAIGGLLNLVQSVPGSTLVHLQADRLLFSRITYFNVGLFAEMVAMAAPLLAAALLARDHLHLSRLAIVAVGLALLVSLAGLFFTFSKSGYLSAAAGLLALVLLALNSWRQRGAILLAATLASGLFVPWPAVVLSPVPQVAAEYRSAMVRVIGESRFDSWNPDTLSGRGSLLERFYATRAALEMAVDNPQLGIGLDQFKQAYVSEYRPPQAQLELDSAHSMWPEVSAELGFPALFLLLAIYASAFAAAWLVYRRAADPGTRALAAGWLAAMVAWIVVATAFAGDMYRSWRNMASDFVMMAMIVAGAFALYRASAIQRRFRLNRAVSAEPPIPPDVRA